MPLSPILSSCVLAIGIDCTSNLIAQRLRAWKAQSQFEFDSTFFVQFAIFAAIAAPINFQWQTWLERRFPGWKMVARNDAVVNKEEGQVEKDQMVEIGTAEEGRGEEGRAFLEDGDAVEEERIRDWWNIFRKWFADCITLGALINTVLFLVVMGVLKGKGMVGIMEDVTNETLSIIFDSYKIWPIANFLSTTYCPVERRIVFLSCCGLVWNIYLSLVAARL